MRLLLTSLVTLATLALPSAAHATSMDDFSVTGSDLSLTFSLPASPTVSGFAPGLLFYLGDVSFIENGMHMVAPDVYFFNKDFGGGFALTDAYGDTVDDLDFLGKRLFTGRVADPTFKLGTFHLTPLSCEDGEESDAVSFAKASPCKDTLTISAATAATPEPGSLALLGTGALGSFCLLRRRLGF